MFRRFAQLCDKSSVKLRAKPSFDASSAWATRERCRAGSVEGWTRDIVGPGRFHRLFSRATPIVPGVDREFVEHDRDVGTLPRLPVLEEAMHRDARAGRFNVPTERTKVSQVGREGKLESRRVLGGRGRIVGAGCRLRINEFEVRDLETLVHSGGQVAGTDLVVDDRRRHDFPDRTGLAAAVINDAENLAGLRSGDQSGAEVVAHRRAVYASSMSPL